MRCVDLRLGNKWFGIRQRNRRRFLVVASSRRLDMHEHWVETNDAVLFEVRIPRSLRSQAAANWRDYQEECALEVGQVLAPAKPALDPDYVHPKKIRIVARSKEAV